MNKLRKSFYHLEVSVLPGGARKSSHYILASLSDVENALKKELSEEWQWDLLLFYGETVSLSTYVAGKKISQIDLTDYISVDIPSYGTYSLNPQDENYREFDYYENGFFDELSESIYNTGEIKPIIYLDWSKVKAPVLQPPLVEESDTVLCFNKSNPTAEEMENFLLAFENGEEINFFDEEISDLDYGWTEIEIGDTETNPGFEMHEGKVIFR